MRRTSFSSLVLGLVLGLAACSKLPSGCSGSASQAELVDGGDALLVAGRTLEAIVRYRDALKRGPEPRAERGLGLALAALRRWDEAEAKLAPYVKANPDDGQARLALAATLIGRGQLGPARSELETLADAQPDRLSAQLLAAALARGDGLRPALARLERWQKRAGKTGDNAERPPAELLLARGALLAALGDPSAGQTFESGSRAQLANAYEAGWLAEAYLRAGQPEMAERLLLQVTAAQPKLAVARRLLAEVQLQLGQPARALTALDSLAGEALPTDALLRARCERLLGRPAAAAQRLRALLPELDRDKRTGLGGRARLELGRALIAEGQVDAAREALSAIHDPGTEVEAGLALAELDLRHGQHDRAIALLEQLATRHPEASGVPLLLANAQLQKGKPADAQGVLRKYLQAHDEDPRAHHLLGNALVAADQRDAGVAEYRRALALAPGSLAPLERLLALSDAGGDPAPGEQLVREQLALAPRNGALHRVLGERLERRGDLPGAEAAFKAGVDAENGSDGAWLAFGDFYARTARPARALELFEFVLRRTPDDFEALSRAAQMHTRVGDPYSAAERYEKALALRPGDIAVQNNLALVLASDPQRLDRALTLAEAAHKSAPDSAFVADTLGWVRFKRGELDAARQLLEGSAALLAKNAEAQHHLGMTLVALGDRAAGRAALERGLALDPHHASAAEAQHALRAQ